MSEYIANIGGAFLYSVNPNELAKWYQEALDVNFINPEEGDFFYFPFTYASEVPGKETAVIFSIFKAEESSAVKTARLNYRVKDLDVLIKHLKELNISIDKYEEHPEGKFAWLHDPDGNQTELWQDLNL